MKTLLSFRIFEFWFLERKPLVKGRFSIFIFRPLRSVFRHLKRNLVWYFWWKNQWVIFEWLTLQQNFREKKSTGLRWNIVATIANYLMVLFSYSLGNYPGYSIRSCYRTVPSAIWEKFSEFHTFCNLFHEPLGKWNKSKIWETRKIFANIARNNVQ